MHIESATNESQVTPRVVPGSTQNSPSVRIGAATILLVAASIGLVAGFVDLGQVVLAILKNHLDGQRLFRMGHDLVWIIPTAVTVVVLVPGLVLALIAWIRRSGLRLGFVVGVLSFVGFLEFVTRYRISFWSTILLCGGFASVCARLAERRSRGFLRLSRLTTPALLGTLIVVAVVTLGGAAWSEHRSLARLPAPPTTAPNVLLIVWDTVRSSNLSLNGYHRPTTPNLESLAGRGARFDHAFAASSWTLPSHATMFTGRWPHEHLAGWATPLNDTDKTLAEYLGDHGYDTAGFVANLDFCGHQTGLDRGFVHYEDYPLSAVDIFTRYMGLGRPIDMVTLGFLIDKLRGRAVDLAAVPPVSKAHAKRGRHVDRAFLDWLSWQEKRNRPFFAFLNYVDAHPPFEVPDESAHGFGLRPSSWNDLRVLASWFALDKSSLTDHDIRLAIDIYDDSIAFLDRQLGILLEELGKRGVLENTLVIVTSDHGEHLGDHGLFFHGCSLYRQLVEVPLVIVNPQILPQGRVVTEPVSLRAIPATVVDVLGLDDDHPFPGSSLSRFWRRDNTHVASMDEPLLMEIGRPIASANQEREPANKGPMKALVASGKHYIRTADGREELYDLASDPEERFNLADSPDSFKMLGGFRESLFSMLKQKTR
jgi:arylsulfatase A-like enzyme